MRRNSFKFKPANHIALISGRRSVLRIPALRDSLRQAQVDFDNEIGMFSALSWVRCPRNLLSSSGTRRSRTYRQHGCNSQSTFVKTKRSKVDFARAQVKEGQLGTQPLLDSEFARIPWHRLQWTIPSCVLSLKKGSSRGTSVLPPAHRSF